MPSTIEDAFSELDKEQQPMGGLLDGVLSGGDAAQPPKVATPVSMRPDAKTAGRPAAGADTSLTRATAPGHEAGGGGGAGLPPLPATREEFLAQLRQSRAPRPTPEMQAGLAADVKATPMGIRGPSGHVRLNPAGQRQYEVAVARQAARYGRHYFSDDPRAPQPEFVPGRVEFNSHLGRWSEGE